MLDNQSDEKLLEGSLSHESLPGSEDLPKLSAREFLLHTPPHELKNIFGEHVEHEVPKPSPAQPVTQTNFVTPDHLPHMSAPTSMKPFPSTRLIAKRNRVSVSKIITAILLIIFILILGLYIWGGLLSTT